MAYEDLAAQIGMNIWLFYLLIIWSLVWKAIALWKSARKDHKIWFIVMIVLNTVGILPILYIFLFSKMKRKKKVKAKSKAKKKPKAKPKKKKK